MPGNADLEIARLQIARNRSEEVAQRLGTHIREGGLAFNTRLPTEQEMAVRFGVSRTVVREAIARLKSEGLIETRQGAGVFVADWKQRAKPLELDPRLSRSIDSVLQVVELRKGIEAEAAALAAKRHTGKELAAIKSAFKAIAADVAKGGDGVAPDVTFHRAIAEASHNSYFIVTLDYIQQFLHQAVSVTRANEARRADFMRQVEAEHGAIIAAIEQGESDAARRASQQHMDNARKRIGQADPAFWAEEGGRYAKALLASGAAAKSGGRKR